MNSARFSHFYFPLIDTMNLPEILLGICNLWHPFDPRRPCCRKICQKGARMESLAAMETAGGVKAWDLKVAEAEEQLVDLKP